MEHLSITRRTSKTTPIYFSRGPSLSSVPWTTRMDRGFFWISFTSKLVSIRIIRKWIWTETGCRIFIKLWNIFGFPLLKDFSSSLLEGYFIISLVEIKLEMKLDKSCAGYEKLRDYVSSLGWRMYFFFVPGKPIFHEEFSNQEHSFLLLLDQNGRRNREIINQIYKRV